MTTFPKSARLALGLSQRQIAAELDVTDRTVRYWEDGKKVPKLVKREIWRMVDAAAEKQGMTRDEFMADDRRARDRKDREG